ncbi:MAG: hypothetical protein LGR52_11880 [Candidatus Thiosymbion ectosymbiont of Robbea hypermnestra]|nr:hypothetical protein [Candidatus Thiosymbion ectosymbiont of Robbea hypermnestra]
MPGLNSEIDVRLLARWLGIQGVKAGLKESRYITVETLNRLAKGLEIEFGKKATRQELIDEIVRVASKRIDKSVDELYRMEQDEIVCYLDEIGVESEELLDFLKQLDLDPGREGRKNLIRFVARELSETGRFKRIASKGRSP